MTSRDKASMWRGGWLDERSRRAFWIVGAKTFGSRRLEVRITWHKVLWLCGPSELCRDSFKLIARDIQPHSVLYYSEFYADNVLLMYSMRFCK